MLNLVNLSAFKKVLQIQLSQVFFEKGVGSIYCVGF